MLKNISKLGKTLNKVEQRNINGGSLLPSGPIGDAEDCNPLSTDGYCNTDIPNSCGLSQVCVPYGSSYIGQCQCGV